METMERSVRPRQRARRRRTGFACRFARAPGYPDLCNRRGHEWSAARMGSIFGVRHADPRWRRRNWRYRGTTLQAAIEMLPRRPERIVIVKTEEFPSTQESRLRDLDGFVPGNGRVIYL